MGCTISAERQIGRRKDRRRDDYVETPTGSSKGTPKQRRAASVLSPEQGSMAHYKQATFYMSSSSDDDSDGGSFDRSESIPYTDSASSFHVYDRERVPINPIDTDKGSPGDGSMSPKPVGDGALSPAQSFASCGSGSFTAEGGSPRSVRKGRKIKLISRQVSAHSSPRSALRRKASMSSELPPLPPHMMAGSTPTTAPTFAGGPIEPPGYVVDESDPVMHHTMMSTSGPSNGGLDNEAANDRAEKLNMSIESGSASPGRARRVKFTQLDEEAERGSRSKSNSLSDENRTNMPRRNSSPPPPRQETEVPTPPSQDSE